MKTIWGNGNTLKAFFYANNGTFTIKLFGGLNNLIYVRYLRQCFTTCAFSKCDTVVKYICLLWKQETETYEYRSEILCYQFHYADGFLFATLWS